jgi:hypothetical protein
MLGASAAGDDEVEVLVEISGPPMSKALFGT